MSGAQIGSGVGQIIGSYFGPVGQVAGGLIGGYIGSAFDPAIYNRGPRIADLKLQNGSFGTPIAVSFGTSRLAGTVIWETDIQEHQNTQSVGKSAQKTYDVDYTYTVDCAVLLTDQHAFPVRGITGVRRIWANGALVRTVAENATIGSIVASSQFCDAVTIYPGDYDQLPDPTMEAALGVGNVSAYRGFAYAVFQGIKVDGKGSPLPQLEFEVVQGGTVSVAKSIFGTLAGAVESQLDAGNTWCGADAAMIVRYSYGSGGALGTTLYTYTFQAGIEDPQERAFQAVNGHSNFPRTFANCATAPIMADINYLTDDATDGAAIRIWDMRPDPTATAPEDAGGSALIATFAITVTSYPAYSLPGSNRVAYEVATAMFAFGGLNSDLYYGRHLIFNYGVECLLPVNRDMIDLSIYLGILYVWNLDRTTSPSQTYITAYSADGTMLFDDLHTLEGFGSGDQSWARLLAHAPGIFTWSASAPTRVARYSPHGPTIVCNDADAGPGDTAVGDATGFGGFWTDGTYANIGPATLFGSSGPTAVQHVWTILFESLTKGFVTLGYGLSTICRIAGLTDDQVDTSQQTQTLRGYSFKSVASAVSFLQPLCTDFFVEGYESEGQIKFRTQGGDIVAEIPFEDLAWSEDDTVVVEPFPLTRIQEKDLPRSYTVVYANWDADFQVGSEAPAKRLITTSVNDVQVETPITATADEASQRQSVLLYKAWLERNRRSLTLARKYAFLEPSDPVMVEYPKGTWKRYRCQHGSYAGPVLAFDLVPDDPATLVSTARGANVQQSQQTIALPVPLSLELMDIAPLDDTTIGPLVYAKMVPAVRAGTTAPFRGANLLRTDDGSNASQGSVSLRSILGNTTNALPDYAGANTFDESGLFTAALLGGPTPNSVTRAQALAGNNAFLVGSEILVARNIVLVTPGVYRFSGLLRYLRGTDDAPAHSIGDRVVALEMAGMLPLTGTSVQLGALRTFAAVSSGRQITSAATRSVVNADRFRQCFPPVNVRSLVGMDGITIDWNRRTRLLEPDLFEPGFRVDELDEYFIQTSPTSDFATVASVLPADGESYVYDNLLRYYNQLRGEATDFYARVAQVASGNITGRYSLPALIQGGVAPNPKSGLFVSTTGADGTTTFVNSGAAGGNVSTVGAVHITSDHAVFAGGTDSIQCTGNAESLFGLGIGIFEIRMKFTTSATGVLMAHTTPAFDQGSWRVVIADVGPFAGLVQFFLADFAPSAPLLQSYSSLGSMRDGAEHEVRIFDLSATGNTWGMEIDGVGAAANGWRNRVGGSNPGPIQIGNDTNLSGAGFVGTIQDPCINLFAGI